MPSLTKPSIVFAHGLWADGSCFSKLIPALQADGYAVFASQHGLNSLESGPSRTASNTAVHELRPVSSAATKE